MYYLYTTQDYAASQFSQELINLFPVLIFLHSTSEMEQLQNVMVAKYNRG
jgi:hypothetical protein